MTATQLQTRDRSQIHSPAQMLLLLMDLGLLKLGLLHLGLLKELILHCSKGRLSGLTEEGYTMCNKVCGVLECHRSC